MAEGLTPTAHRPALPDDTDKSVVNKRAVDVVASTAFSFADRRSLASANRFIASPSFQLQEIGNIVLPLLLLLSLLTMFYIYFLAGAQ